MTTGFFFGETKKLMHDVLIKILFLNHIKGNCDSTHHRPFHFWRRKKQQSWFKNNENAALSNVALPNKIIKHHRNPYPNEPSQHAIFIENVDNFE